MPKEKPAPKRRRRIITPKQAAFAATVVDNLLTTGDPKPTEAARQVYGGDNPDVVGNQQLNNSNVQSLIRSIMIRSGVTAEKWSQRLGEAMDATEIKLAQKDGIFTDEREVPDWSNRLKALELTGKVAGYMPKEDAPQTGVIILQTGVDANNGAGHPNDCICDTCIDLYNKRDWLTNPKTESDYQKVLPSSPTV